MKADTLEELIEYLSKRFDVSYAKLARIVVKTAKWQKEQMLQEADKIQVAKAVLEKRRAILKKAIEIRKLDSCPNDKWLDGKESGYSDALDLLNGSVESIRMEL